MLNVARHRFLAIALVVMLTAPAIHAQGRFTLEQIMSSPFPSNLVAAPAGDKVAWVQNAEGVRNIWVAEAPTYEGRQITQYAEDDGQEVGNLQFTIDGSSIVYVRGGGPNRQGEIPNPLSDPESVERAIWIVVLTGGEPRKLSEGSSPSLSPAGDRMAFMQRGQVWSVTLEEDATAAQLFQIRGGAGSLRWSPDGAKLAFVSSRGDHSFIGAYDIASESVRYLDPSVDRDRSPVWSPDGRQIAFIRQPQVSGTVPFVEQREALPWSIRVADLESGIGREIWKADEGAGSVFHGVVADNQLFWGDGNHIVFPWEGEGWTHLYSVSANGGAATLLTPGEFEVQEVLLNSDRSQVVYSSNQDDIDRRHIWSVEVDGGRPEAITTGNGSEWTPTLVEDAVAMLVADARRPAHAAIKSGSGDIRPLAPRSMPRDFPSDQLVEPEQVIFSAADGMQIHGQLFVPANQHPGEKYPAVLFFHGGSRRQMLLGWHHRGYYHNAYALNQYLASQGYVVLSVNYRSGIGYGMEFREALNYGAHGASEFNDVLGAGLYLQSRADVDPSRIGLWGGSYGGYLTALGLARASDLFAAGVDLHGVHDWNLVIRNFVPSYNPAEQAAVSRLAFESSPMAAIDGWRSPVLLIHGDDDRNVPFSETIDLVEQLRKRGVYYEQLIFPDEVHGFLLHRNWMAAYQAAADFFDRMLKGSEAAIGRR